MNDKKVVKNQVCKICLKNFTDQVVFHLITVYYDENHDAVHATRSATRYSAIKYNYFMQYKLLLCPFCEDKYYHLSGREFLDYIKIHNPKMEIF